MAVDEDAEVTGGAQKKEVEVVRPEDKKPGKGMINVITTAPGTYADLGIVKVGTKMQVELEAYSKNWMKPADKASEAAIEKAADSEG